MLPNDVCHIKQKVKVIFLLYLGLTDSFDEAVADMIVGGVADFRECLLAKSFF